MDIRVQESVVANLSTRSGVVEAGPFVIGWDPANGSRHINYATPRVGAVITPSDVSALVAAFREIDRVPRLEYVTSCAPGLERQLIEAGFSVEERLQYLVCSPDCFIPGQAPEGFVLGEPTTDAQRAALATVQHEAFGAPAQATSADVERIQRAQALGGVVVSATGAGGACVGGGQASPPSAGVSEVAGIAVHEAYRRRGIAGAVTAAIATRLFASGVDVAWLEAGGEDSWRVYERVGFAPTGDRVYMVLD